jgi:hypothetical protein
MDNLFYYVFVTPVSLCLIFINCLLSKDIYEWTPSIKKQIGLYILVWFLPVVGLYLANKLWDLGRFAKRMPESGSSTISCGFMEMDSFFNPGVKHTIEAIEKQKHGVHYEKRAPDDKVKKT